MVAGEDVAVVVDTPQGVLTDGDVVEATADFAPGIVAGTVGVVVVDLVGAGHTPQAGRTHRNLRKSSINLFPRSAALIGIVPVDCARAGDAPDGVVVDGNACELARDTLPRKVVAIAVAVTVAVAVAGIAEDLAGSRHAPDAEFADGDVDEVTWDLSPRIVLPTWVEAVDLAGSADTPNGSLADGNLRQLAGDLLPRVAVCPGVSIDVAGAANPPYAEGAG